MLNRRTFERKLLRDVPYLTVIIGDRGSGKTNLALCLGETLLSNKVVKEAYVVLPTKLDKPEKLTKGWKLVSTEWLEKNLEILRDAYIVLDEGLISLNARARRNRLNRMIISSSAVARHRGLIMTVTTQAHRVDVQLRELSDAVVIKKTSMARLVLLDKPPKWIKAVDKALRKAEGFSIEELSPDMAVWIGAPITNLIYGIPIASLEDKLNTRARDRDLVFK